MIECKAARHVTVRESSVVPVSDAVAILQNLITRNIESLSAELANFSQPTLVSFEVILDNADVLLWLQAQPDT
ncbi:MAG: hypothetical protein HGB11_10190, partial [Chlorobiales bacterium]|nr:hypothetical protein [Chlorobiales bacterium]